MSRTTRSSGRSQGLVDHFGNRGLRQISPTTPRPFHDGVQLLVGQRPKGLINALQTGPRCEKDREYLPGKLLPLPLGESQNFLRQGLDSCGVHARPILARWFATVPVTHPIQNPDRAGRLC